jgi:hypothetical protein
MPIGIVRGTPQPLPAKGPRISAALLLEDLYASEADAMSGPPVKAWDVKRLWSICWRAKVALALMGIGLVIEILKQTLR